jgi:hypothetical protein
MAMTKPVIPSLVKTARAPRLVSGVQMQKPVMLQLVEPVMGLGLHVQRQMLHSPNAFPLHLVQMVMLPGYPVHCSQMLRIAGKTGNG